MRAGLLVIVLHAVAQKVLQKLCCNDLLFGIAVRLDQVGKQSGGISTDWLDCGKLVFVMCGDSAPLAGTSIGSTGAGVL
ncbi:MAG: hypothetical protein U0105_18935 [Candidatus Obscuribacterales bacterium]